jgi:hypothetical protein
MYNSPGDHVVVLCAAESGSQQIMSNFGRCTALPDLGNRALCGRNFDRTSEVRAANLFCVLVGRKFDVQVRDLSLVVQCPF